MTKRAESAEEAMDRAERAVSSRAHCYRAPNNAWERCFVRVGNSVKEVSVHIHSGEVMEGALWAKKKGIWELAGLSNLPKRRRRRRK